MQTDTGFIGRMNQGGMGQIALALGALLGQDVTFKGVLALDFSASGQLEALARSGFGFHFRHGARVSKGLSLVGPEENSGFGFLFRGHHHIHPLSFQLRQTLDFAEVFEFLRQFEQQNFALVFVDDGTTSEKHVGLDLKPIFQKLGSVLLLEVVVVFVRLGSKPNFLDHDFHVLGSEFLLLLFLIVQELSVVDDLGDRWIGLGRNFDQIEFEFLSHPQGRSGIVHPLFGDVFSYQTNLWRVDALVDPVLVFLLPVVPRVV